MTSTTATSNIDSLLIQIKRNLGLPVAANRSTGDSGNIIDAAPFVAPYLKGERIHRMADWTISSSESKTGPGSSAVNQSRARGSTAGLPGFESEMDWTLSLAESSKPSSSGRKPLGPRPARGVLPPRAGPAAVRSQTRPANTKV